MLTPDQKKNVMVQALHDVWAEGIHPSTRTIADAISAIDDCERVFDAYAICRDRLQQSDVLRFGTRSIIAIDSERQLQMRVIA